MKTQTTRPQPRGLDSIQHLRAVAALSVVVLHVGILQRFPLSDNWPRFLASGVDVFFVISGFVMWHTTAGSGLSGLEFLLNRLRRIVPLYWAVTGFMLMVMVLAPGLAKTATTSLAHMIASFAFVPWPAPGEVDALRPLVGLGWTLNYEMFFYVIFAVWLGGHERMRLLGISASLIAIAALHPAFPDPLSLGSFYTSPIIGEFLLGIAIAVLFQRASLLRPKLAVAVGLAGVVVISLTPDLDKAYGLRFLLWGLPAAAIVLSAVSLENAGRWPTNRLAHILGDASYSLYLVHGIVLSATTTFWIRTGLSDLPTALGVPLFALAATLAATLGGVLTWRFFERPVDRALRRMMNKPKARDITE